MMKTRCLGEWCPRFGLLLLMLLLPAGARAQAGVIQGVVRESETGSPLMDAQVEVVGTNTRVLTDLQGRFRIAMNGTQTVELEASRLGFAANRVRVEVVPGGTSVEIALPAAPIHVPEVSVIGRSRSQLDRIPGSAEVVSARDLILRVPLSGNEVLRSVAGIHVQEEEGLGLRVNIGVRGLNPDRSRTVLILEDGVPVALNPYGEPEMYYAPPIERMERIEIVKGSGSIAFGPQTIGGVINFVTPGPPAVPGGWFTGQLGSGDSYRLQGAYGGTWQNVGLHTGFLHREIGDMNGLFARVSDATGKVGWQVGGKARAGFKLSVYDEESNSTYVGLTEAMYASDPYQHPAPDDRLWIRRYALSGTHDYQLRPEMTLRTTAYGYTTTRDWSRQNYGYSADGRAIVLQASTGNRNRSFEVLGIEPRLQWNHGFGGIRNELDAGVRAQREYAEDAHIDGSTATARTGNVRDHENRFGEAFSAFVQNRFLVTPALQVVPGLRLERYSYERHILRTRIRRQNPTTGTVTRLPEDVDIRSGDRMFEVIPGLGVNWSRDPRLTLFAGAHRGFSPPRVKDALVYSDPTVAPGASAGDIVSLQLDAEKSMNVELGLRSLVRAGVSVEATAFLLDFSNQIIPPSLSAGSVAQATLANQGETRHAGVESAARIDWGEVAGLPFALTTELKHTYSHATFSADRYMRNLSGDTVNVRGNRLPYAPANLWIAALGIEHPAGATLRVDGLRVDGQYTDNFETVLPLPNGRTGLIPAHAVWNVSGSFRIAGGPTVFGTVKNVFDTTYIASRRPEGIRAGLPRLIQIGARMGV
jgi:Fe(3+) dicitrate transport protein